MKIAIPVAQEKLCLHFGHCEKFLVFDVDQARKTVNGETSLEAPPHQPGLLPAWLAEKGVTCVIAGGMGSRAQNLFSERNITVVTGAPSGDPKSIVNDFLEGKLSTGPNACDH
ncbi:MAG: NifB/NifX family molybdenum-iron cluster-binding protein [Spirochaetes bacterium]|nr:NifB/NifX family molybdenum-iron cluster-binding protein [Spirochaetota bacterium]